MFINQCTKFEVDEKCHVNHYPLHFAELMNIKTASWLILEVIWYKRMQFEASL